MIFIYPRESIHETACGVHQHKKLRFTSKREREREDLWLSLWMNSPADFRKILNSLAVVKMFCHLIEWRIFGYLLGWFLDAGVLHMSKHRHSGSKHKNPSIFFSETTANTKLSINFPRSKTSYFLSTKKSLWTSRKRKTRKQRKISRTPILVPRSHQNQTRSQSELLILTEVLLEDAKTGVGLLVLFD